MFYLVVLLTCANAFVDASEDGFFAKASKAVEDVETSSDGSTAIIAAVNWIIAVVVLVGMLYHYNKVAPAVLDCCTVFMVVILTMCFGILGVACGFCMLNGRYNAIMAMNNNNNRNQYGAGSNKV